MGWTDQTHDPYRIAPDQSLTRFLPPNEDGSEGELGRYLSLLHEADTQVGRLLDGIRERGLADDTLVAITGDHGEAFGEPHGGGGHGFTVYDEETRVPLMLWNPRLFNGSRSETVGSHVDLAPTLLDVIGMPPPRGWDGRSFFDASRPSRAYMFAVAFGQYLLGVRDGDWKYIYDARRGREELYDLSVDPDEQKNVAPAYPDRALRQRQRLAAWLHVEQLRQQAGEN